MTVRVLVVEDEEVIRSLIAMACERDPRLELVASVRTGAEALASARALSPDVAVVDLGLPDMDGIEVIRQLREEGSALRILILTARGDPETIFEARRVGADGFVEKSGAWRIAELIGALAEGTEAFSEDHDRIAREELRERISHSREVSRAAALLTERELEVLRRLAEGDTTRQVARALALSERTVEAHIGKLYRKLGVGSRIQAVSAASALGLLERRETTD